MKLAELQRTFESWLVTASAESASRLGPMSGLTIYQNNYRAQLVGCLEASYPYLRNYIGEEEFLASAISHIDAHPPHAWTLDAYADGFDATLAARYPDNPDVQELAWIEHALTAAFIAADAMPLPLAALAEIDWDTARLQLTPSLRSRVVSTNAETLWSALWQEEALPDSEMLAQPGGVIVWRRGYTSYLKQIDALEYGALLHLRANGSFASLCDMLVERLGDEDGVAKAGALLAGWLNSELIVSTDAAQQPQTLTS